MTHSLAIYGKGGSGKSTVAAALSSCFADTDRRVLHFGCDPKADSSRLLLSGKRIRSVMGTALKTDLLDASSILMTGIKNITCIEAGGPEPGVGCAGRGITRTFELLRDLDVSLDDYDMVIYDVLGDVVCGGFATPMKDGYARQVLVVASGSILSLLAANNIMKAVRRFYRNGVRLAGLVGNYHTGDRFRESLIRFAQATGTKVLAHIPHDPEVQKAEESGMTIRDYRPGGSTAAILTDLAGDLLTAGGDNPKPRPLDEEAFETFLWQMRDSTST
jgi:nitrogenase iron protein NifH